MSFRLGFEVDHDYMTTKEDMYRRVLPTHFTKVVARIIHDFLVAERFYCCGCDKMKPDSWGNRLNRDDGALWGYCDGCIHYKDVMNEYENDTMDDCRRRSGEYYKYELDNFENRRYISF